MTEKDFIRITIEAQVDEFIKDYNDWIPSIELHLSESGIDPNLDTTLSFMIGLTFGITRMEFSNKYERLFTGDENQVVKEILKRRAIELRMIIESQSYK